MDTLRIRRIPDADEPLFFWTEQEENERWKGLACRISICDNPDCKWIHIKGIPVDKNFQGKGSRIQLVRNRPKRGGSPSPDGCLSAHVHVETGKIRIDGSREKQPEELVSCLLEGIDSNTLLVLQRRWRRAKGLSDRESWRQDDWSWWDPGTMVPYVRAFPDDLDFIVLFRDRRIWVMDYYCITPDCSCRDVLLSFQGLEGESCPEPLGAVSVNYCRWSTPDLEPRTAGKEELGELWKAFLAAGKYRKMVPGRHGALKEIGRELARRSSPPRQSPPPPPATGRSSWIPRNSPCSCGSGRKYKNCCGR